MLALSHIILFMGFFFLRWRGGGWDNWKKYVSVNVIRMMLAIQYMESKKCSEIGPSVVNYVLSIVIRIWTVGLHLSGMWHARQRGAPASDFCKTAVWSLGSLGPIVRSILFNFRDLCLCLSPPPLSLSLSLPPPLSSLSPVSLPPLSLVPLSPTPLPPPLSAPHSLPPPPNPSVAPFSLLRII